MNVFKGFNQIDFDEHITINDDGTVSSDGIISFFNPKHISALLCNYSKLKENAFSKTAKIYSFSCRTGLGNTEIGEDRNISW